MENSLKICLLVFVFTLSLFWIKWALHVIQNVEVSMSGFQVGADTCWILFIFKFLHSVAKYGLVMCCLHTWYHVIQNQAFCIERDCYVSFHAVPTPSIFLKNSYREQFWIDFDLQPIRRNVRDKFLTQFDWLFSSQKHLQKRSLLLEFYFEFEMFADWFSHPTLLGRNSWVHLQHT